MAEAKKIAVLGAGPMGLAVAYQLVKDGYSPVVFEADDRVGGMAATFDFGGLDIERYYHFHCTSDDAFFDVLNELGLDSKMQWTATKMGYWYKNQLQSWGNPFALLGFKGLGIIPKVRYGLHAFLSTKRSKEDWKDLDHKEATSWIKNWVGEKAFEALWRNLFELKFYDYANNLSAAWIWSRIRRIGQSRYSLFKEKLGYLDGGSNTLLKGMKDYIEANGGEFKLSEPVLKVSIQDNKVTGVKTKHSDYQFDTVISTVPLPYVSHMIPDLPEEIRNKYSAVKNIAVVCIIVKLKRQVTENFWLNVNDPDMDIPGIVEYTNLRPMGNDHIVYIPYYIPGDHSLYQEPDELFIAKVKKYIKRINPLIVDTDFVEIHASRYRYAQPICQPGFLDQLPPAKLPVCGLWIADTSYYYPEDRGIAESIQFGRDMARDVVN
jgi:protoporphyrinogen oxidase